MKTTPAQGPRALSPAEINAPLILDMLAWIARERRPYAEVMETWRTSCPRLTIWEDAVDDGLVVREPGRGGEPATVALTDLGRRALGDAHVF
jgi:hypothetical protein